MVFRYCAGCRRLIHRGDLLHLWLTKTATKPMISCSSCVTFSDCAKIWNARGFSASSSASGKRQNASWWEFRRRNSNSKSIRFSIFSDSFCSRSKKKTPTKYSLNPLTSIKSPITSVFTFFKYYFPAVLLFVIFDKTHNEWFFIANQFDICHYILLITGL